MYFVAAGCAAAKSRLTTQANLKIEGKKGIGTKKEINSRQVAGRSSSVCVKTPRPRNHSQGVDGGATK